MTVIERIIRRLWELVRGLFGDSGSTEEPTYTFRDLGALPRWISAEITHHPDGYDTITLKHTEDYE